MTQGALALTFW